MTLIAERSTVNTILPAWKDRIEADQFLQLHHLSWAGYIAIGDALAERGNLHLTFDRGSLEIMTLSPEHERLKYLTGRFIEILSEETGTPTLCYGQMTHQREDLVRGLEADDCYYIRSMDRVRGMVRLDLGRDPPPDLVVEIAVTSSSVDRIAIFEKLAVAEVWQIGGGAIKIHLLNADGSYEIVERSLAFPQIEFSGFIELLKAVFREDNLAVSRMMRSWIRDKLSSKG